jgi:hypothetical protein
MKTQNEKIKAYLNKGKSITPMDALNKFGCFRLSARIKNLRDEGLKIATNYVTKGNKTFASYSVK